MASSLRIQKFRSRRLDFEWNTAARQPRNWGFGHKTTARPRRIIADSVRAPRTAGSKLASLNSKAPDCSGPFLSKPSLERILIFASAWRSSHRTGLGTSVVLVRWIRRVAFLGTAARARPCGHAFFVFRFLARGSAGTDVSFTRRAGRGLALSRRNKRRAEE